MRFVAVLILLIVRDAQRMGCRGSGAINQVTEALGGEREVWKECSCSERVGSGIIQKGAKRENGFIMNSEVSAWVVWQKIDGGSISEMEM